MLCLHGHFYQPPRENPWLEQIEVQDSAAPFHDWNERVTAECYGPNGAARIKSPADRIVDIVNSYRHLSFNFGPTLLAWLEQHRPDVYARVLEADAESLARRGHGNAIAQGFNHAILPLCSPRDLRTQIRWGLADFRHRFRREAEGFWLPETAADSATLEAIAEEGVRFTILSPYQVHRVRAPGGAWVDATGGRFDPTRPYRVRAGRHTLVVFFYDGHIARELAFGEGLSSAGALISRLQAGYDDRRDHPELLTIAIDGETLGHHKKGADEALAEALRRTLRRDDLEIVNPAQALDRLPVEWEAEILEQSSWSCAHGIERWRSDCGCHTGGQPGWRQAWRAPLRAALDGLRDHLAELYEREAKPLLRDPWGSRDRYVQLMLDADRKETVPWLEREAGRLLPPEAHMRALWLLEMQRQTQLMYTSCGWFFSELSGLETVQVMKYAARALQLALRATGQDFEPEFIRALERAPSNVPELRDGGRIYERLVQPSLVTLEGVGAHLAIASLIQDLPEEGRLFVFDYALEHRRREREGPAHLSLGRLRVGSRVSGDQLDALFCVIHFGSSDFRCGLVPYPGEEARARLEGVLFSERISLAQLLREVDRVFTGRDYNLRDLFLDGRRRVAASLLEDTQRRYEADYQRIFDDNSRLMLFLAEIDSPLPSALRAAADVSLTRRLLAVTRSALQGDVDPAVAESELTSTVELASVLGAQLDLVPVRQDVEKLVRTRMAALVGGRGAPQRAKELVSILELARRLGLWLNLWPAQNQFWDWTQAPSPALEQALLAQLSPLLWFDPAVITARAAGAHGA